MAQLRRVGTGNISDGLTKAYITNMASQETRKRLNLLRDRHNNNKCFECNTHSPQWVSVSNGVFICLECSGIHRSLGVHVSFVRSVTMDQWKEKEHRLMEAGGNARCQDFLDSHRPDYSASLNVSDKWNSRAAALWRDKLATEADGRTWHEQTSSAQHVPLMVPKAAISQSNSNGNPNKYTGFGSSANVNNQKADAASDAWASLSGWGSYLADVSTQVAGTAANAISEGTKHINETVIKPTVQKAQEGELTNSVTKGFWSTTEAVRTSQFVNVVSSSTSQFTSNVTALVNGETGQRDCDDDIPTLYKRSTSPDDDRQNIQHTPTNNNYEGYSSCSAQENYSSNKNIITNGGGLRDGSGRRSDDDECTGRGDGHTSSLNGRKTRRAPTKSLSPVVTEAPTAVHRKDSWGDDNWSKESNDSWGEKYEDKDDAWGKDGW
eukprot:CFRG0974T1